MESLKAHLLVAAPQLPDANFYRTVVLMIQHDEDGALGLVLNRPSNIKIAAIWQEIAEEPCERQDPVNWGGPVEGPLMAVHTDADFAETEILPGVFLATDRDHLNQLVRQQDHELRIFVGYSGWGGGQLDGELAAGGWLTTPARREHVFHGDEDLWKTVSQRIGSELLHKGLKLKPAPDDPSWN